jgi:hypothetical protein
MSAAGAHILFTSTISATPAIYARREQGGSASSSPLVLRKPSRAGPGYVDRIAEISRHTATERRPNSVVRGVDRRPDILDAFDEAQTQSEAGAVRRAACVCLGRTRGTRSS